MYLVWSLKNISQIGNLPQIGVNIKNIWNHHLDINGQGANKIHLSKMYQRHKLLSLAHRLSDKAAWRLRTWVVVYGFFLAGQSFS